MTSALLNIYSSLLTSKDGDVAEAACLSFQPAALTLCSLSFQSEVMVTLLQVVHVGASQQGKLLCIQLLCALAPAFGPELTRRFVVNELLSIVDDMGTADKKVIAENFQYVWSNVDAAGFKNKLMDMFHRLVTYSDGLVRVATISGFAPGLDAACKLGVLDTVEAQFSQWYLWLLQDGSRLVQLHANSTLPYVLCALRAPAPALIPFFLESFSKNSSKEYVSTCAHCLPTLIAIYGAEGWSHLRLVYTKMLSKADPAAAYLFCSRIHEVAKAVGPENTDRDLVPVFNDFHKNKMLRLALINHLGEWIAALPGDERDSLFSYLKALGVSKDWRERAVLGQELGHILPAFSKSIDDSLLHLSISLAMDRYDRVSVCGCTGTAQILTQLFAYNRDTAETGLELIKMWANSRSWSARKRFLRVAAQLDCRRDGEFAGIREAVVRLAKDPVANVRVMVAEIVAKSTEYDPEFAAVRDEYRTERDVDISRTVATTYDNRTLPDTAVLPPTLFKPTPPRTRESRLQLLTDPFADTAQALTRELSLDESGFPLID